MTPQETIGGPTVGQVLRDVGIPGAHIGRTVVSALFAIAFLLLTRDGLLFRPEPECLAIEPLQRVSFAFIVVSLLLAALSVVTSLTVGNVRVSRMRSYWVVYRGKVLIDFAVLVFFCVVCVWVIGLGGITRSPFAMLLCLSPALILISWFTERGSWYDSIRTAIAEHNAAIATLRIHTKVRRKMRMLGFVPLVVVTITLVLGQIAVARLSAHEWFLSGSLEEVLRTDWYYSRYYALYYLSAAIAIFGATLRRFQE